MLKSDTMFFNATEMAKNFNKRANDFIRLDSTQEYIEVIISESGNGITRYEDLSTTKQGGKYQGTWLHKELAFEFAGWCSAMFRRKLHKWAESRIEKEHDWQRKRLEAKTGFLPLTNAIEQNHNPAKFYHFSTECNLINNIVLGMTAKAFKEKHEVDNVRDSLDASQLADLNQLQIIDTGLIAIGMSYNDRKENLTRCHERELNRFKMLEAA